MAGFPFPQDQDAEPMAKKKAPKTRKPGRPKSPEGARLARISFRAFQAWADWLRDFARDERMDITHLIDAALAKLAEARGRKKPPMR